MRLNCARPSCVILVHFECSVGCFPTPCLCHAGGSTNLCKLSSRDWSTVANCCNISTAWIRGLRYPFITRRHHLTIEDCHFKFHNPGLQSPLFPASRFKSGCIVELPGGCPTGRSVTSVVTAILVSLATTVS